MITVEQVYDLCGDYDGYDDGFMSDQGSDDSSIGSWESRVFQLCRESLRFCKYRINPFGLFDST